MFNNPAADIQQPIGDAIVVAGRVAAVGGKVTVRLADWFPSWPYKFTSMTDWFDKLGQTVSRRKSANLTNIYAYEIWNEPNGTWTSTSIAFNDFWRQTYVQLRQIDPTIKITGPSISYYNQSYLQSFLSYCKTNSCVPDIVGWHELSGGNVTANIQNYRSMEKTLGIGPLPITINEYSGAADLDGGGAAGRVGVPDRQVRAAGRRERLHLVLGRQPPGAAGESPGDEHRSERRLVVLQVVRRHGRQHGLDDAAQPGGQRGAGRLRQPGHHRPERQRSLRGDQRRVGPGGDQGVERRLDLRGDGPCGRRAHAVRQPDDGR